MRCFGMSADSLENGIIGSPHLPLVPSSVLIPVWIGLSSIFVVWWINEWFVEGGQDAGAHEKGDVKKLLLPCSSSLHVGKSKWNPKCRLERCDLAEGGSGAHQSVP